MMQQPMNQHDYQTTRDLIQNHRAWLDRTRHRLKVEEGLTDEEIARATEPNETFIRGLEEEARAYEASQNPDVT